MPLSQFAQPFAKSTNKTLFFCPPHPNRLFGPLTPSAGVCYHCYQSKAKGGFCHDTLGDTRRWIFDHRRPSQRFARILEMDRYAASLSDQWLSEEDHLTPAFATAMIDGGTVGYSVIAEFTAGRLISLFKKFVVGFSNIRYVPEPTIRPVVSMAPIYTQA